MCRHLAYLGPPASLRSLLIDPPHSLYRQSWAPRRQRFGTVNADGFGIGWYAPGDPVPARYRRGTPIWGDESLPDIARVTSATAVLAAVRSATSGMARGAEAAAPFGEGPWLFSHNGAAEGWRDWAEQALVQSRAKRGAGGPRLAAPGDPGSGGPAAAGPAPAGTAPAAPAAPAGAGPAGTGPAAPAGAGPAGTGSAAPGTSWPAPPGVLSRLEALVDSALLWALVLDALRAGCAMDAALAATTEAVAAAGGTGRFNFLLTDGHSVAATACGDTLWYRRTDEAVTVASEPGDDEPGWTEVPDRHLLTAVPGAVTVRPLGSRARQPITKGTDSDVRTEGIVIA